jgi:hypothetical protein
VLVDPNAALPHHALLSQRAHAPRCRSVDSFRCGARGRDRVEEETVITFHT